jgi:hypothetical protein
MFGLIAFAATIAATVLGYLQSRSFVRRRLAYVDAVHNAAAPLIAGAAAFVLAIPVVGLLPLIGGGTALLFGAGVGAGVAAGARDTRYRRVRA